MSPPTIVIQTWANSGTVFEFVANPKHEVEWNPSATRVEPLSAPPFGVGSAFRIVGRMLGREMTVDLTVVEFDPPSRTSTLATSGPMRFATTFIVHASDSGTTLTMSVDITIEGPLRIFAPLIRAGFTRRLSQMRPRLSAAIEAHAAEPAGE